MQADEKHFPLKWVVVTDDDIIKCKDTLKQTQVSQSWLMIAQTLFVFHRNTLPCLTFSNEIQSIVWHTSSGVVLVIIQFPTLANINHIVDKSDWSTNNSWWLASCDCTIPMMALKNKATLSKLPEKRHQIKLSYAMFAHRLSIITFPSTAQLHMYTSEQELDSG